MEPQKALCGGGSEDEERMVTMEAEATKIVIW